MTDSYSLAIAVRELTKSYGSSGFTSARSTPTSSDRSAPPPALAPLTITIDAGHLVAIIGHNGSGKTTLLRMIAGLLDPSSGNVAVHGADRGSVEARRDLSYLADQPTFYDDLSLREHLEYVARLHDVTDWADRAAMLVGRLGLVDRIDQLPTTFSRGLRQKAAITLAFIRPFRVLLVDEPFVGLDAAGRAALLTLFDDAHAEGSTVVVATHDLGFVHRANRLIALADGEVRYDGPPGNADVNDLVLNG